MKNYRIRKLTIYFLDKSGAVSEVHETKFFVPPICLKKESVYKTIKPQIKSAIGTDKRKRVVQITTAQGKFYFNK